MARAAMFRLTKKRGRRHKSADSLLVAAPVEQQKKETFSLALPGKYRDAQGACIGT